MELVLLGSLLCYGFTEKRLLPARSPANVAGPYATKEPFLLALTHGESNFRQNFPFLLNLFSFFEDAVGGETGRFRCCFETAEAR